MLSSFIIGASIGLLGGFHCMAMCGPIVTFLHTKSGLTSTTVYYNLGRILTYTILGVLIGIIGNTISLFGFQQITSIISGAVLILLIVAPNIFNRLTALGQTGRVITNLRSKLVSVTSSKSPVFYFSMGMLNGLLPCGLVYMALISAFNANNIIVSATLMFGFGLGTFPLMSFVVIGLNFLPNTFRLTLKHVIPAITILVGILLIVRGLALDIPYLSPMISGLTADMGIPTCGKM